MPALRLWIETTHHAAFRYGGWAYLREIDGVAAGVAGGERGITAGRLELTALIALLTGLPPGAVTVKTSNASLLAALRLVANPLPPGADGAPSEDPRPVGEAAHLRQGARLHAPGRAERAADRSRLPRRLGRGRPE